MSKTTGSNHWQGNHVGKAIMAIRQDQSCTGNQGMTVKDMDRLPENHERIMSGSQDTKGAVYGGAQFILS